MREFFTAKELIGDDYWPFINDTITSYKDQSLEVLEGTTLELEEELEKLQITKEQAFAQIADALHDYAEHPSPEDLNAGSYLEAGKVMRESTLNHAKTRLKIKILSRLRHDLVMKQTPKEEEEV